MFSGYCIPQMFESEKVKYRQIPEKKSVLSIFAMSTRKSDINCILKDEGIFEFYTFCCYLFVFCLFMLEKKNSCLLCLDKTSGF